MSRLLEKLSNIKHRKKGLRWAVALTHELFPMLLVVYLALLLVEVVFKGSVSSYLNLNYLLIAVVIVGVITVLTAPHKAPKVKEQHLTRRGILVILGAGVLGAVIVWYNTKEIGWMSYLISVVSGALIVLLCLIVCGGAEEKADEGKNSQGN